MTATQTAGPDPAVLDEYRVRLVEAAGRRIRLKEGARARWQESIREADRVLVEVVNEARESGLTWRDLKAATGISRQNLVILIDAEGRSPDVSDRLAIIGYERALIDRLTKLLHDQTQRHHNHGTPRSEARGSWFTLQILDPDGGPTGRIAKVTVELDRVEEDL